MSKSPRSLIERVEDWKNNSTIRDGHWLFNGGKNITGYGQVGVGNKMIGLHRISAHIYLGLDLDSIVQQALHKPSCPYQNCWCPDCLYIGTVKDNHRDMRS